MGETAVHMIACAAFVRVAEPTCLRVGAYVFQYTFKY